MVTITGLGVRQVEMFKASAKKSLLEGPSIQITGSGFQILHSKLCLVPETHKFCHLDPCRLGSSKFIWSKDFCRAASYGRPICRQKLLDENCLTRHLNSLTLRPHFAL